MRGWAALAVVLAVALVVRLALVAEVSPRYQPAFDAADYDRHAHSIAAGDGYPDSVRVRGKPSAFRPPGYPYLLAGVYKVTGKRWTGGLVLAALLGTLIVLLLYLVAAWAFDRRVALVAAGLAAVFPPLVGLSASLLSEPLFVVIELGLVAAVLAYRRQPRIWPWAAAAGLLAGLGALTRANGLLLVVPAAIGVWTARPLLSRRAFAAPTAVVLVALVAVVPWTVRNTVVMDHFLPGTTQTGFALAGAYNDESRTDRETPARWHNPAGTRDYRPLYLKRGIDEVELDSDLRSKAVDYVGDHPGYVPKALWWNTLRLFDLAASNRDDATGLRHERGLTVAEDRIARYTGYAALALALAGIALLLRMPRGRRGPLFMWLVPPLMIVGAMFILGNARYRAPLDPFTVLLAAIALIAAWDLRPARLRPRPAR
jgi:4-amino-4-deoxy-L-arabinose transferase-like glycosyltransferase